MSAQEPIRRDAARAQIRELLSTRRSRITPEQAGLPSFGGDRRRVRGLRREEAALLVGVSPQYYVRLERGEATGVSDSIIEGITRALQLDAAERAHLTGLLRDAATPTPAADTSPARLRRRRAPAAAPLRPTIARLVDAMPTVPAVVLNGRLDVLAANPLGRALFSPWFDDPDAPANTARLIFLDAHARTLFREWETVANDTVALLRAEAGRDPFHRELTRLVGELSTRSDDFRVRWAAPDVRGRGTGVAKLHHHVVGDLDLPYESLPIQAGSTTRVVTYLPEPHSPEHESLTVLAGWAAEDADPAPARRHA